MNIRIKESMKVNWRSRPLQLVESGGQQELTAGQIIKNVLVEPSGIPFHFDIVDPHSNCVINLDQADFEIVENLLIDSRRQTRLESLAMPVKNRDLRVNISGCPGSGKSLLAAKIAKVIAEVMEDTNVVWHDDEMDSQQQKAYIDNADERLHVMSQARSRIAEEKKTDKPEVHIYTSTTNKKGFINGAPKIDPRRDTTTAGT